jgi:LysM repeat protein
MSYIRDAMEKAEMQRKNSTPQGVQDISAQSPKKPLRANKTILTILCLQFLWIFVLGGIFYVYIKQDYRESVNSIMDKMEQLGVKLDPLKDQIARVEDSVKSINRLVTEGVYSAKGIKTTIASQPKEIPDAVKIARPRVEKSEAPAVETKPLPLSPPREMPKDSELYHKVEQGETLFKISKRYKISVQELRRLNKLQEDQAIKSGQKLLVSPGGKQ